MFVRDDLIVLELLSLQRRPHTGSVLRMTSERRSFQFTRLAFFRLLVQFVSASRRLQFAQFRTSVGSRQLWSVSLLVRDRSDSRRF
jgi:hypothetical protein